MTTRQCIVWVQVSHLWANGSMVEREVSYTSLRRKKEKENMP